MAILKLLLLHSRIAERMALGAPFFKMKTLSDSDIRKYPEKRWLDAAALFS